MASFPAKVPSLSSSHTIKLKGRSFPRIIQETNTSYHVTPMMYLHPKREHNQNYLHEYAPLLYGGGCYGGHPAALQVLGKGSS